MKLFVEVTTIMNLLAFLLTLLGLGKKASVTAVIQILLLSGWITWGAILILGGSR